MLCKNLFTSASEVCDADGQGLLVCSVITKNELVVAENKDLRNAARWLEARASTTGPAELLEYQHAL